ITKRSKMSKREIGRILLRLRAIALALRACQIRNWTISNWTVQFEISDFGSEMQDSSDFRFPSPAASYGAVAGADVPCELVSVALRDVTTFASPCWAINGWVYTKALPTVVEASER